MNVCVDDDLRALEREASQGGTAERLRYARALERAGRRDESLDALLPARADPQARAEIARFPAWTHDGADEGKTSFVDVAPIRSKPPDRPRWVWHSPQYPITGMRASPLGIVAIGLVDSLILDPDEGTTRHNLPGLSAVPYLDGERLIALPGSSNVFVHDLWTGREVGKTSIESHELASSEAARIFPVPRNTGLVACGTSRLDTGVRAGRIRELEGLLLRDLVASPDRLLAALATGGLTLIHRKTGRTIKNLEGVLPIIDERGFVCAVEQKSAIVCCDPDGEERWRHEAKPGRLSPVALTPDAVLVQARMGEPGTATQQIALLALDRARGVVMGKLQGMGLRGLAVARDVVYVPHWEDEIRALALSGQVLWTWKAPERTASTISMLAPLGRKLYGLARDSIFCLEEA